LKACALSCAAKIVGALPRVGALLNIVYLIAAALFFRWMFESRQRAVGETRTQ
jgi:hypothetical protein